MVVRKDRRAVNAAKVRKNDIADSEFCEERRTISENEKNNVFFVGSVTPDMIRQDTRRIEKIS